MIDRFLPERVDVTDAPPVLGHASRETLGPVVRVLVWNIFKARRTGFVTDFEALTLDRDLVLLQESVLNAPSDRLFADSRRFQWIMGRSFREPRSRREHGVKTGAVCPATEVACWQSRHAEPVSNTRKSLLATRYRIAGAGSGTGTGAGEGAELLVLNMHAINFVAAPKYLSHLAQLGRAMAVHRGPLILAGDFNTWNERRRSSLIDVTREAGLNQAPLDRRARVAHLARHLDHLLYRGLRLRSATSLEHIGSSDHAPIEATFEYPGQA